MSQRQRQLAELAAAEVSAVLGLSSVPDGLTSVLRRWLDLAAQGGRGRQAERIATLEARVRDYQRAYAERPAVIMDRTTIHRADEGEPLHERAPAWRRMGATVFVSCPAGHVARLDHDIAADGTVSPSLVCPEDGCGWHVWGRLAGWTP